MKKISSFLLVLSLLLSLLVFQASAEGGPVLQLSNATAAPGEEVELTLSIQNYSGMKGISAEVSYDTSVLTLVSATPKISVGTWSTSILEDHLIYWYSTDVYAGEEIISIRFKVADGASKGDTSVGLLFGDWDGLYDSAGNDIPEFTVTPGTVTITGTDPQPEFYGRISGLGANLNDAMDLKVYVKDVPGEGTPRFRVTQPDRAGNPVLTQAASEADYALSNSAVYTVNWDEANSRWIIRIKVFPKFISSPFTVELLDENDEPLPLKGYLYQGIGSNEIKTSHSYSFLDYVTIMKIWKADDARYADLYSVMTAYDALMKRW